MDLIAQMFVQKHVMYVNSLVVLFVRVATMVVNANIPAMEIQTVSLAMQLTGDHHVKTNAHSHVILVSKR